MVIISHSMFHFDHHHPIKFTEIDKKKREINLATWSWITFHPRSFVLIQATIFPSDGLRFHDEAYDEENQNDDREMFWIYLRQLFHLNTILSPGKKSSRLLWNANKNKLTELDHSNRPIDRDGFFFILFSELKLRPPFISTGTNRKCLKQFQKQSSIKISIWIDRFHSIVFRTLDLFENRIEVFLLKCTFSHCSMD